VFLKVTNANHPERLPLTLPREVKPVFEISNLGKSVLHPPRAALAENGLEVTLEELVGVEEILFGVGFGGGDSCKRFVQQADDPPLFG
jgi:hypothetical protein